VPAYNVSYQAPTHLGRFSVSMTSESVVEAALKLPEPERAQVVQELLDSLSPDAETHLDDAWAAELDRRLAEFQKDGGDGVSWSELREQK